MYSDYHLHSHHSGDSEESCESIINKCIELGMNSCCFTDHNDFCWPNSNENFDLDIEAYFKELLSLQEIYNNKIDIRIGVECGITEDNISLSRKLIQNNPFDFVIGSCHIVNGVDPYYPDYFLKKTDREAFEEYFSSLLDSIRNFSDFDVLGHIDYVVRYSPNKESNYSAFDYMDIIDEILKVVIVSGKGIEINTSGLKNLSFANPCPDILKRYKELGGEIITIGSDAHTCQYIGNKFEYAGEVLRSLGFSHYFTYKNRTKISHKL